MTHLSALQIDISAAATWLQLQHVCGREEPGVSVLAQYCSTRRKKSKGEIASLKVKKDHPKQFQQSGEKANEEGTKE